MKKTIVLIVMMFLSFFISGLFLLNTGMFDKEGNFDRQRTYQIVLELEKIPLLDISIPSEGNPGNYCVNNHECVTPMSFLIQSNCPFTSQCIGNTCRVVCPITFHDLNQEISKSYPKTCNVDEDCNCDDRGEKTIECSCNNGKCFSIEG